MNLYVGNLSPETTEGDLRTIFSEFGEVVSVKILLDAVTGLPRGFGFVEIADKYHGYDCITNLDMTYYQGNIINVRESKPKGQENTRGGGGGFNRGGGNRSGGSGGGFNRNRTSNGGYNRERTYNRDSNGSGNSGGYNRERTYNRDNTNRDTNYNKDNGNSYNSDSPLYKNDDDLNFNKL
jgi:RNA recognition motif-containing protein